MGFVRNLKENGVDVKGKKMTIMGAGGAATAVQVQSALDGAAKISIFNRVDEFYANAEHTKAKIKEMLPECDVNVYPLEDTEKLYAEIKDSDILVNATKVGMKPLDGQSLIEDTSVFRPDLDCSRCCLQSKGNKICAGCKNSWL